jgi:hypothetical protein
MKLFIVYLYGIESDEPNQLVGVFDCAEKVQENIRKLESELNCTITENDYEVIRTFAGVIAPAFRTVFPHRRFPSL